MPRLAAASLLTLLLFATRVPAQDSAMTKWADSVLVLIHGAMAGDRPDAFDPALALLDRVLAIAPKDGVMLHYKGYALYRKSSLMLSDPSKEKEVKALLEEADDALEQSAAALSWAETPALRASVLGQIIGVSGMFAGMRLGPKADGLMDEAVKLGPNNPRVYMLRGVSAIFKPKMFGGGTDKAERDLKRAIELFPSDRPAAPQPAWGHAEAYAWLGQVYAKEKKIDEARLAYAKALELQPGFHWVSRQLLPALDKIKR